VPVISTSKIVFQALHIALTVVVLCHAVQVWHPDDQPVWRQLLRLLVNHSDPATAQQAAAALATALAK
jgi:hypothetical protein